MQSKRVTFRGSWLAYALVGPQLAVTGIFFLWPAAEALYQSVLREDAFGLSTKFVGLENFRALFNDPNYLNSFGVTLIFSASVAALAMGAGLLFAATADYVVRGASGYKTLLIMPYAVAPAIAGVLWWFLFNPSIGILAYFLHQMGYNWDHLINGGQALFLIIVAAAWKEISYNFIFFLAGMQAIPRSLIEAAAIDGAGPVKRFRTIIFPLLAPTTFFVLVVNVVYAFFETFAIVHATTQGGPGHSTEILVYKVWHDAFIGLDLGGSAAQSVILMAIVIGLTFFQFRFIERRVEY
ncbi:MAG TPA: sn-glycerol-3-phosphate ABC transporter permease UgpA [Pararhizobium sp.]|nr:sn-glycerol-3-phosphate ABC transporter permease UgpA [Pararhizobium sp.]